MKPDLDALRVRVEEARATNVKKLFRYADSTPAIAYKLGRHDITNTDVADLLALVDRLAGVLLRLEWHHLELYKGDDMIALTDCPICHQDSEHTKGCPLHRALIALGLDTQAKRDAARAKQP